jgi:hypothetical protein
MHVQSFPLTDMELKMDIIITYDLNKCHSEVKTNAVAMGFEECYLANDNILRKLPNSTLIFPNANSTAAAVTEFKRAVAFTKTAPNCSGIIIEKLFATESALYHFESNAICS